MDMNAHKGVLDYYATPGPLTDAGRHSERLRDLPADVNQLVEMVHRVGIFDHLFAVDDRPLNATRAPDRRIGCRCHAFTKLIVTMLREKGIPARSRCGFATYFNPGRMGEQMVLAMSRRICGEYLLFATLRHGWSSF